VKYIHGNTWNRTIEHLKMRRETFIERRKQLVHIASRYLGVDVGLKTRT
jgi:hypothetical protein